MPSRVPPIARIRLARSTARMLLLPLLLVLASAGLAAFAWLGPMRMGEPAWLAMVAGAVVLGLIGLVLVAWLLSIRLDVEEAAVRLHSLWGERVYALVPGPVTRVRLRGEQASALRTRTGLLGWAVGRARLRGTESIEIVRLASTPSAILIPTDRGRLAIAPASEADLIDALSRAARARQRLEEVAEITHVAEPPVEGPPAEAAAALPEPMQPSEPVEAVEPAQPELEPAPEPHYLTGIERAELEARLAREREEDDQSADDERIAAAALPARIELVEPAAAPLAAEAAVATTPRRWRVGRRGAPRIGRPKPSAALVLLPVVGAGAVWGAASWLDRLPDPGSEIGRLTALGLVLAGPATSVGAIMARAWWPRIVGVVVTSGLAAAVFVGRAIFGA